jgi:hypothetical protein
MHSRRVQNPFAAGRSGGGRSSPRRVNYSDKRYNNHQGQQQQQHHRHRGSSSFWVGAVLLLLLGAYSMVPSSQPYYYAYDSSSLADSSNVLFESKVSKAPVAAPQNQELAQTHTSPAPVAAPVQVHVQVQVQVAAPVTAPVAAPTQKQAQIQPSVTEPLPGLDFQEQRNYGSGDIQNGGGQTDDPQSKDSTDISADDDEPQDPGVSNGGDQPHSSPVEAGQAAQPVPTRTQTQTKNTPSPTSAPKPGTSKGVGIIQVDADTNTTLFLPNSENSSENQTIASNFTNSSLLEDDSVFNATLMENNNDTQNNLADPVVNGNVTNTATGEVQVQEIVNETELIDDITGDKNQTESQMVLLNPDLDVIVNETHTTSLSVSGHANVIDTSDTINATTSTGSDDIGSNYTSFAKSETVDGKNISSASSETLQHDSNIHSNNTSDNTTSMLDNGAVTVKPVNETVPPENTHNVTSLVNATTINKAEIPVTNENETVTVLEPTIPKQRKQRKPRGSTPNATQPEIVTNNSTAGNATLGLGKNETLGLISGDADNITATKNTMLELGSSDSDNITVTKNETLELVSSDADNATLTTGSDSDIIPETNSTATANASTTLINITASSSNSSMADGVNATNSSLSTLAKTGNLRGKTKKGKEVSRR